MVENDGKQNKSWILFYFNVLPQETSQSPKWRGLPITGGQLDLSPVLTGACIPAVIWEVSGFSIHRAHYDY